MSLSPLAMEMSKFQLLKERLTQIYSLDEDEETLADTLEGITNLHEMLSVIIRSALVDQSLQEGLRSRLEEMKQRLARFEERGTKKRQVALEVMTEIGLKKLEQPDFTASTRAGSPSLLIVAEDIIPEAYWVPQPPKLDRQSLLAQLKRGREIPGAQLSNPKPTLAVRIK
jgi:hypothetical protein